MIGAGKAMYWPWGSAVATFSASAMARASLTVGGKPCGDGDVGVAFVGLGDVFRERADRGPDSFGGQA